MLVGRFPRGKRGLKYLGKGFRILEGVCRFPRGKRGLKFFQLVIVDFADKSLPPREAWIEMPLPSKARSAFLVASPAGSVD